MTTPIPSALSQIQQEMGLMQWSKLAPTEEGNYLFKLRGEWLIHHDTVRLGDWRRSQNPDWMYVGSFVVNDPKIEAWLGPLPEYDQNVVLR